MAAINDVDVVKEQYKNADKLNTRISIHSKYSVNKTGFGNWIISHYDIKPGCRILELGCGTGDMWREHKELLEQAAEVVLTDFSEGMVETVNRALGGIPNLSCQVADIQKIPFGDDSFDIVIANMMLYHVPQLEKGLSEVKRVLKDNGTFYCATYGENGIVAYISGLLQDLGVKDKLNRSFTLQNGSEQLGRFFRSVRRLDYEDALEVTNIEDMLDYVYSLSSMTNIERIERETLRQRLEAKVENGVLHVPKEYGMFVCKKMYPIRKINGDEVNEAIALASEVFMQFEAPDYSPEGVDSFQRDIVENEVFIDSCKQGIRPIYAAFDGDKIIGIMGMRPNKTHISLAFVKKEYHRQGVATALFHFLLEDVRKDNPDLREITLNASPYGKAFYLHMGFTPLSEEKEVHGIRFTPMKYVVPFYSPANIEQLQKADQQVKEGKTITKTMEELVAMESE